MNNSMPARTGRRLGLAALAVAAVSLLAPSSAQAAGTSSAASNRAPIGHLDSVVVHGSVLTLTGWAADLDTPHNSIDVRAVFSNLAGLPGSMAWIAHDYRSDVASSYPALGPNHGFSFSVDGSRAGTGRVCLYGLDLHGGPDGALGCATVTLSADQPARGHLDSVRSVGNSHIEIIGWAADDDTPSEAVSVNLMLGGSTPGTYYNIIAAKANQPRSDVAIAFPALGPNHGFDVTVAARPGRYPVCALAFDTAINHYGGSSIGCITVTG